MRTVRRSRKYPVRLSPVQSATVEEQAAAARTLWNLLHAYYCFYESSRRTPTLPQLEAEIRRGRAEIAWLGALPAQAAQQVLRTYIRAWHDYWAGKRGRPTWKPKRTRAAVDIPQAQHLMLTRLNSKWGRARLPKAGWAKVRMHQSPPDRITGARLVKDPTGWFLVVRGEVSVPEPPKRHVAVLGIDRGVSHSIADSEANFFDQPATLAPGEERRLYRLERKAARQRSQRPKGQPVSNRLSRTYDEIRRLRAKQPRRRYDFAHRTTAALVAFGHATYAIEDLRTADMTRSARGTNEAPGVNVRQKAGLNRAIRDQGWRQIDRLLTYKSEQAGACVVRVDPKGTSRMCHRCGSSAPGQRESQALFRCANAACGWVGNADYNAAVNIKTQGQGLALQDVEPIAVRRAAKRHPGRAVARSTA